MNILILHSKVLPSEYRLAEFLKERGCYVVLKCISDYSAAELGSIKVHAVINRVYSRDVARRFDLFQRLLSLIDSWENRDIPVINGYVATLCDINKYALFKRLSEHRVNTPATYAFYTLPELEQQLESLPEDAYVIKPACGGCAEHVARGLSRNSVLRLGQDTLKSAEQRQYRLGFVLQRFEPSPLPVHYRIQMVGEYYVCCHSRSKVTRGEGDPWLTSASQGSDMRYLSRSELPDGVIAVCQAATRACDCLIAGIDLLVDRQGHPMVVELNATPFLHAAGIHPRVNEQEVFLQLYLRLRAIVYQRQRNPVSS